MGQHQQSLVKCSIYIRKTRFLLICDISFAGLVSGLFMVCKIKKIKCEKVLKQEFGMLPDQTKDPWTVCTQFDGETDKVMKESDFL